MSTYTHESGLGKGPAYSISGRPDALNNSEGPGPGAYTPELPQKTVGASMGGRYPTSVTSDSPGPGAYPNKPNKFMILLFYYYTLYSTSIICNNKLRTLYNFFYFQQI